MANGNRFETYAIPGDPNCGQIILNGATAHLGNKGDRLTIMTFSSLTKEEAPNWTPKVLVLDEKNQIVTKRGISAPA